MVKAALLDRDAQLLSQLGQPCDHALGIPLRRTEVRSDPQQI